MLEIDLYHLALKDGFEDYLKDSDEKQGRNWACVVYPDSAPEKWLETLSMSYCQAFVSPLHDSDVNPGGEPKKPHYHVMVMYEGNKSQSQIKTLFSSFGGVGCLRIGTIRGYARYMCHLDNPEKHLYHLDDVICLNGAEYFPIISLASDKYNAIREMLIFCRKHEITSYALFLEYCAVHKYDWFRILCDSGTVVMKEYLKSLRWELHSSYEKEKFFNNPDLLEGATFQE